MLLFVSVFLLALQLSAAANIIWFNPLNFVAIIYDENTAQIAITELIWEEKKKQYLHHIKEEKPIDLEALKVFSDQMDNQEKMLRVFYDPYTESVGQVLASLVVEARKIIGHNGPQSSPPKSSSELAKISEKEASRLKYQVEAAELYSSIVVGGIPGNVPVKPEPAVTPPEAYEYHAVLESPEGTLELRGWADMPGVLHVDVWGATAALAGAMGRLLPAAWAAGEALLAPPPPPPGGGGAAEGAGGGGGGGGGGPRGGGGGGGGGGAVHALVVDLDLGGEADPAAVLRAAPHFPTPPRAPYGLGGRFAYVRSWRQGDRWLMLYRRLEPRAPYARDLHTRRGFLGLEGGEGEEGGGGGGGGLDLFLDAGRLRRTRRLLLARHGQAVVARAQLAGAATVILEGNEHFVPGESTQVLLAHAVQHYEREAVPDFRPPMAPDAPPPAARAYPLRAMFVLADAGDTSAFAGGYLRLPALPGPGPGEGEGEGGGGDGGPPGAAAAAAAEREGRDPTAPEETHYVSLFNVSEDIDKVTPGRLFIKLEPEGPSYSLDQFESMVSEIREIISSMDDGIDEYNDTEANDKGHYSIDEYNDTEANDKGHYSITNEDSNMNEDQKESFYEQDLHATKPASKMPPPRSAAKDLSSTRGDGAAENAARSGYTGQAGHPQDSKETERHEKTEDVLTRVRDQPLLASLSGEKNHISRAPSSIESDKTAAHPDEHVPQDIKKSMWPGSMADTQDAAGGNEKEKNHPFKSVAPEKAETDSHSECHAETMQQPQKKTDSKAHEPIIFQTFVFPAWIESSLPILIAVVFILAVVVNLITPSTRKEGQAQNLADQSPDLTSSPMASNHSEAASIPPLSPGNRQQRRRRRRRKPPTPSQERMVGGRPPLVPPLPPPAITSPHSRFSQTSTPPSARQRGGNVSTSCTTPSDSEGRQSRSTSHSPTTNFLTGSSPRLVAAGVDERRGVDSSLASLLHLDIQDMSRKRSTSITSDDITTQEVERPPLGSTSSFTRRGEHGPDDRLCVLCMDLEKDALLAPCGHICCCHPCALALVGSHRRVPRPDDRDAGEAGVGATSEEEGKYGGGGAATPGSEGCCPMCRAEIREVFRTYYS